MTIPAFTAAPAGSFAIGWDKFGKTLDATAAKAGFSMSLPKTGVEAAAPSARVPLVGFFSKVLFMG